MAFRNTTFRPLVVIPALNAAKTLPPILDHLVTFDTLVVDDGSEDDTFQVAATMATIALRHDSNQGHSTAIRSGENYALENGYSHVLLVDSDGQHPPEYAQHAINLLEMNDLVIGDRFGSLEGIPNQKIASNLFASLLIECATGCFLRDVSCGFRGYYLRPALRELTTLGYSRVYSQIIRAAVEGAQIARIRIPAVYPRAPKPVTRASEIQGLCHAVLTAFPANSAALSIMSALQQKVSFRFTLMGVEFAIEMVASSEDYCFAVNQEVARRLYAN